jgi:hypothetical protein
MLKNKRISHTAPGYTLNRPVAGSSKLGDVFSVDLAFVVEKGEVVFVDVEKVHYIARYDFPILIKDPQQLANAALQLSGEVQQPGRLRDQALLIAAVEHNLEQDVQRDKVGVGSKGRRSVSEVFASPLVVRS